MKTRKDGRHHFKWMKYDGRNVAIDKDIAVLLSKMWRLGIHTTNSCQASCSFVCKHKVKWKKDKLGYYSQKIKTKNCDNNIWIAFDSVKDIERFYNIVAEYVNHHNNDYDSSMYHRMGCDLFVQTNDVRALDGWCFSFYMCNRGTYGHWGRPTRSGKRSTYTMWVEEGCDKNHFVIEPQITIPHTHLKFVEEKLDSALKQKKK